jgi:hypothetical protein
MSTALISVDQVERMALAAQSGPSLFRTSTDAAGLCREIVLHSAKTIQGRKFVQVEGCRPLPLRTVAPRPVARSSALKKAAFWPLAGSST